MNSLRILEILKLDSLRLYQRIRDRRAEYIEMYALKRSREHFTPIFKNKYDKITISELGHCEVEVISTLDSFYTEVDRLHWYFLSTEDMPGTMDEKLERELKKLSLALEELSDCIDRQIGAELGDEIEEVETDDDLGPPDLPESDLD